MKKFLSILLCVLLVAAVFAGCSPKKEEEKGDTPEEQYEIAVVVKIVGIPFFNVFEDGVKKAAEDFNVNAYVTGPTEADAAQQVKIIEDLINTEVDAIVVVPNDATALEAVLERAREKGILVIANESPGQIGADYDVELIDNKEFAYQIAESFATAIGGKGEFAMFVGGLSVPLHNTWADYVLEYFAANYPEIVEVTDRIPCGEDAAEARTKTLELIKTYPNLSGVIGFGSQGPLGAAEAVKEKELIGKFVVAGNVVPSEAAAYLKEGSINEGYLWNPADSGYATVYTAKYILEGGDVTSADFAVPEIGTPVLTEQGVLAFNATLVITKDNCDSLGF